MYSNTQNALRRRLPTSRPFEAVLAERHDLARLTSRRNFAPMMSNAHDSLATQ